MKLLYVANIRMPIEKAHGIQIMKMCEIFAKTKDTTVELIVPKRFNEIKDNSFDYYGIKPNFKITKLPCIDLIPLSLILGNLSLWIETVSFLFFLRIYLFFKKYDILYTREEFVGLFFKNFILEIHSVPANIKYFHKMIWRRAKKLIVLTSYIKNKIISSGLLGEKILVAPDGVDLEKFNIDVSKQEARRKLNLPTDKKIILYSGSFFLYDWKGVDIFLEAAKLFPNEYLFVLVGGSQSEAEQIKNNFKMDNLLIVGHQPYGLIPYFLKAADVLILPNKQGQTMSEEYTSPLKLFEYMAANRGIVASDLPSIREVLNENNAQLVKPNDSASLADGIKKLIYDNGLYEKISRQALADVQNYTWQKRANNIFNFLKL